MCLQGCRHDRASAGKGISESDYNYGYQHNAPSQRRDRWRTVMAYNCPGGCTRLLRFSSNALTDNGIPLGSWKEDNARFIRERLSLYANFRTALVQSRAPPHLTSSMPGIQAGTSEQSMSSGTRFLETVSAPGTLIGASGNMFDIVAKKRIRVTNLAVTSYASTIATIEIFILKNPGSFEGHEYDKRKWQLIGITTIQTTKNHPSTLPEDTFLPVEIEEGQTQAFYVTFREDTNYNRYTRGTSVGEVYAQNDEIQFKTVSRMMSVMVGATALLFACINLKAFVCGSTNPILIGICYKLQFSISSQSTKSL